MSTLIDLILGLFDGRYLNGGAHIEGDGAE